MKPPFLKIDFPDLEPHEALRLLIEDLQADALYIEGGEIAYVRSGQLLEMYIDLGRQALVGRGKAWVAAQQASQASDPSETKKAETKGKSCRR